MAKATWRKRLAACLLAAALLTGCAKEAPAEVAELEVSDPTASPYYFDSETRGAYNAQGTTAPFEGDATAVNPLSGLRDMPLDRQGLRPYAVFVNNLRDCLPQYGVSKADVIVKMQTEGGITRYMCLFDDLRDVSLIGPIRSLRYSFVEATAAWEPLVINMGAPAMDEVELWEQDAGWRSLDVQQAPEYIWYDESRNENYASEHNWFFTGSMVDAAFQGMLVKPELHQELDVLNFAPEDADVTPDGQPAQTAAWNFSTNGWYQDETEFRYEAETRQYAKWQFGAPCIDAGYEGTQLAFDNLLILFCRIEYDRGIFSRFQFDEGGEGWYLSRGHAVPIRWVKPEFDGSFLFTTGDGEPLTLNRGKSYIAVVDQTQTDTLSLT